MRPPAVHRSDTFSRAARRGGRAGGRLVYLGPRQRLLLLHALTNAVSWKTFLRIDSHIILHFLSLVSVSKKSLFPFSMPFTFLKKILILLSYELLSPTKKNPKKTYPFSMPFTFLKYTYPSFLWVCFVPKKKKKIIHTPQDFIRVVAFMKQRI